MKRLCHLEEAVGRIVPCPEARCGFWVDGCALAGIRPDLSTNPHLSRFLLALRRRIEAETPSPADSVYAFLPPGLR